ncbi:LuxR C-terminal-related transcriptional regulator [Mesorhizobium sp. LHD-90]|uniref:helix-turn-helix transcriptional regulator n=1 Tax=Mesorhizobium sp. LHD-90 TaxID=3071414 RepID=UPI0027DF8C3C|nr:LuxR C-terminal-related transcriptional regulator [Mesorhizobium sp. LHD-90]MDQ6435604.1 LuxR C-terminal-related transcriptional regulator [Mesorhizobium sp. LHD-90]
MTADPCDRGLAADLARDLLGAITPEMVDLLTEIAATREGLRLDTIAPELRLDLQLRLPSVLVVDRERGYVRFRQPAMADLVAAVAARMRQGPGREQAAVPRINGLIAAGALEEALVMFRREGGAFFSMVHGLHAATSLLELFPETLRGNDETLVLAAAVNALKAGNLSRAEFIVQERFGASGERLFAGRLPVEAYGTDFQCFRFIYAIYMEEPIGKRDLERLFDLLGRLPLDSSIQRGLLYNVALDVFVRQHNWDTAAEAGLRSRHHYESANAILLAFYIDLYLALINLVRGRLVEGNRQLERGSQRLAEFSDASPNDHRLLSAFNLIAAYEAGDAQPLIGFALSDDPETRFGEIWPSVAEPIIAYGCLALSTHVTLAAARSFLDRWRLQEWRSDRFVRIVNVHELTVLQAHRRWQEADELLLRVSAERNLAAAGDLGAARRALCTQQDDIDLALAALRSAVEADPHDVAADAALASLADAPQATPRQRAQAFLWRGVACLATGNEPGRRDALTGFFELQRDGRLVALIDENRGLLERVAGNKAARSGLLRSPRLARFLRELPDVPRRRGENGSGMTRQEERILFLLAEHVPNKTIARRLGVSVPTVKFHLRNIYRKLGAADRDSAMAMAFERRLLSE